MKKYIAFISYSRKDKSVADWLHSKLESYRLPDKIKCREIFPFEGNYLRPVFIDTQDLHVEERPFTDELKTAITHSTFLIVICSRHSAVSPFVEKEINYFLETHDRNYSKIIPLFCDEVDGAVPPAFDGSSIMQRHFPIYNTHLSNHSEANNYCFYQIIAYILKLNFSDVYNRYEVAARKELKKRRTVFLVIIAVLTLIISVLGISYYQFHLATERAIERKQRLIEFEKKVFPAAVVHGYERNFLTPVINHLKEKGEKFKIFILMPQNERDLTHQDRVGDFVYDAKQKLGIDSITFEYLPTETKRGNHIMRLSRNGAKVGGVYLDFATTTTSFLEIAKFKKKNREYRHTPLDSIIQGYASEFVSQTNDKIKSDSAYVKFYYDKNIMISDLKQYIRD